MIKENHSRVRLQEERKIRKANFLRQVGVKQIKQTVLK